MNVTELVLIGTFLTTNIKSTVLPHATLPKNAYIQCSLAIYNRYDGKIQTFLKPSEKWEMIWKSLGQQKAVQVST